MHHARCPGPDTSCLLPDAARAPHRRVGGREARCASVRERRATALGLPSGPALARRAQGWIRKRTASVRPLPIGESGSRNQYCA